MKSVAEIRPIGGTWYYLINATGEVAEISVRVQSVDDWKSSAAATDPTWRPMIFGDLAVAVKVLS